MKIMNFLQFIKENNNNILLPFQFSIQFEEIMWEIVNDSYIGSSIAEKILKFRNQPFNLTLVDITDGIDNVSFTSSIKLSQLNISDSNIKQVNLDSYKSLYFENRTTIKIGRFVKKLFGNEFSDKEIEEFVNKYKAITTKKLLKFEITEDFIRGYSSKNYTYEGSNNYNPLLNSCMNDEKSLLDFYKLLPVKLLLLLNEEGHIFGRSIIWETDNGTFMDRIYTALGHDYYKFIDYAKKNNIIYKSENKSGAYVGYNKNDSIGWFEMSVSLDFEVEKYNVDIFTGYPMNFPYMDTFIYAQKNKLSNKKPEGSYYILNDVSGTYTIR